MRLRAVPRSSSPSADLNKILGRIMHTIGISLPKEIAQDVLDENKNRLVSTVINAYGAGSVLVSALDRSPPPSRLSTSGHYCVNAGRKNSTSAYSSATPPFCMQLLQRLLRLSSKAPDVEAGNDLAIQNRLFIVLSSVTRHPALRSQIASWVYVYPNLMFTVHGQYPIFENVKINLKGPRVLTVGSSSTTVRDTAGDIAAHASIVLQPIKYGYNVTIDRTTYTEYTQLD
ncbi:hypothetical protein IW262DRAFT_1300230 [Armillaria fumosa]|nr:hypothetical protein IW262DRAFT_1300230 [Armillaria fumosa]